MEKYMDSPFMKEMLNKLSQAATRHGHSLDNIESALEWVVAERKLKLTPEERVQYQAMLAGYPYWKILKVSEYHGPISGLWKFLDDLQPELENAREQIASYKQIEYPSPERREIINQGMKDVFQYTQLIPKLPPKEADAYEREFYDYMRKTYPWTGEWKCVRKANQTA